MNWKAMAFTSKEAPRGAEEERFAARIADQLRQCEEKQIPRFSNFLDERQLQLARLVVQREGDAKCLFFGGAPECERKMLGVFPYYLEPEETAFPIAAVTAGYREQDVLTHRDFLGALMGLLIKRETVGDIFVAPGCAVLFTFPSVAPIIVQELTKVGRVGVVCQEGLPPVLPAARRLQDIEGTVSSLRLDCVLALLLSCSREKAAQLVRGGAVQVNAVEADSVSRPLEEGDKLSVRGHGKFLMDTVGGVTKKGRIHLNCKKYC